MVALCSRAKVVRGARERRDGVRTCAISRVGGATVPHRKRGDRDLQHQQSEDCARHGSISHAPTSKVRDAMILIALIAVMG